MSSLSSTTDIHTVFITDKIPSESDSLIDQGAQISSAAYLRAHAAFASSLSLAHWLSSDKGTFIHGALKLRASQEADPLPKLIQFVYFFERAEGNERPDFDRGAISRSMSRVIPVMVKATHFYSAETLSRFSEELDKRIEQNAKHLTMPKFRRAYALELYDYEGSSENAKRRIGYRPSAGYQTPFKELSELGETIVAYAEMDLFEEAKALLSHLKVDGLGVSRRAKKDPQYLLWESVFKRVNEADPRAENPELGS